MQPDRTRCTQCGGTMETGFILDYASGGRVLVSTWAAGGPQKHWWGGLKNATRRVLTDQCTACGYLKSYANTLVDKRGVNS
jgi:hypothetical protein